MIGFSAVMEDIILIFSHVIILGSILTSIHAFIDIFINTYMCGVERTGELHGTTGMFLLVPALMDFNKL